MAYVVVSFKGQEVGRWPLKGPLTVGRSTECDVVVRDILLSRRHCEIAPYRNGWVACDLGSKNGTTVGKHPITRRGLSDGDVLKLGKTTVRFQIGRLPAEHKPPAKRPADPFEALSGTVTDFDPKAAEAFCQDNNLPKPQPIPPEPAGYSKDDLYSLLTEIASSSWDSIYAQASQPKRPIPRGHLKAGGPRSNGGGGDGGGGGTALATLPETATATETDAPDAPAATEALLTRRSRLGFAEELQVGEVKATQVARPASPFEALAVQPARPASPGAGERPKSLGALLGLLIGPLAALHRWVAPAGRVLIF